MVLEDSGQKEMSVLINQAPSAAMHWAPVLMVPARYWLGGTVTGFTLPQSGPLYVAVDCDVMFIVCPLGIVIVIWTVVFVVFASTNVVCTVPVMLICPVQLRFAVMPAGVTTILVVWQLPLCGLLYAPPYLSIMAWVTQICEVCDPIWDAIGMPDMFMLAVISQRPGFCFDWPCAQVARVMKQQLNMAQTLMFRMNSPYRAGFGSASYDSIAEGSRRER
jgi:hypothetical protein